MKLFHQLSEYLHQESPPGDRNRIVVLLAVSAMAPLLPAFLTRVLFDRAIPDNDRSLLVPVLSFMLLSEAAAGISRLHAEKSLANHARKGRQKRRAALCRRVWRLSVSWFEQSGPGKVQRHFDDAGRLGDLPASLLRDIVRPALVLFFLLPFLFYIHPVLALLKIAAVPAALVVGTAFLQRDLAIERLLWRKRSELATVLLRGCNGIPSLKAGRGEEGLSRHLIQGYLELGALEEERQRLGAVWSATATLIARTIAAFSVVAAVGLVLNGVLSFGSYIAFSILAGQASFALGELLGGLRNLVRTGNSARRHQKLYSEPAETLNLCSSLLPGRSLSENRVLSMKNIRFAYNSSRPVFDNLNLDIEAGERVRINGASGEGKSSLFSLILGFREPVEGTITWFGTPLNSYHFSRRRRLIGAVLQSPAFLDASVRDNLCFFNPAPSDKVLWNALEDACAADVVASMPGELDAMLVGTDSGLSGGQRQRLAIARLLVCPPQLVLLDEATNALDERNAEIVRDSLSRACVGRSVVVVSHGGEPSVPVDRVLTLQNGQLSFGEVCVRV